MARCSVTSNKLRSTASGAFLLLLAAALMGCSTPTYELAPVEGQVTLDGEPITDAKVMFAPVAKNGSQKSGKPAFGMLQQGGEFTLSTYKPDDGAVVGEHWVTVIRVEARRSPDRRSDDAKPKANQAVTWDRVTYPQLVTVAANAENDVTIALTSEIVGKYAQRDF
jgi:hypothetical protein